LVFVPKARLVNLTLSTSEPSMTENVKSKLAFRHTKLAEIEGVQTELQLQEYSPEMLFLLPEGILHKTSTLLYLHLLLPP